MILYLHGFRSSPQSFKARLLAQKMAALGLSDQLVSPQLPASPQDAIALAEALVAHVPAADLTIVGSSLGGFYATWLAEKRGCRAVLLNPAVKPLRSLEQYVNVDAGGAMTQKLTQFHSGEPFEFRPEYCDQLGALEVEAISKPERYYLIAATGDEVLDWREMVAHYADARQFVIEGSDHGLSEFAQYLDGVLAFCGIAVDGAAK